MDLFQDSQNILIRSFLRKFGGSKYLFFVWTVIFNSLFVASVRLFLPFIKYHHPSIHKSLFLANSTYLLGLIRNWNFIELLQMVSFTFTVTLPSHQSYVLFCLLCLYLWDCFRLLNPYLWDCFRGFNLYLWDCFRDFYFLIVKFGKFIRFFLFIFIFNF